MGRGDQWTGRRPKRIGPRPIGARGLADGPSGRWAGEKGRPVAERLSGPSGPSEKGRVAEGKRGAEADWAGRPRRPRWPAWQRCPADARERAVLTGLPWDPERRTWRPRGLHVGRRGGGRIGRPATGACSGGAASRSGRAAGTDGGRRERETEPTARIGPQGCDDVRRRHGATAATAARGEGGGEGDDHGGAREGVLRLSSGLNRRKTEGGCEEERGVYRGGAASRGRGRRCGRGAAPAEGEGGRDGARSSFGSPRW